MFVDACDHVHLVLCRSSCQLHHAPAWLFDVTLVFMTACLSRFGVATLVWSILFTSFISSASTTPCVKQHASSRPALGPLPSPESRRRRSRRFHSTLRHLHQVGGSPQAGNGSSSLVAALLFSQITPPVMPCSGIQQRASPLEPMRLLGRHQLAATDQSAAPLPALLLAQYS